MFCISTYITCTGIDTIACVSFWGGVLTLAALKCLISKEPVSGRCNWTVLGPDQPSHRM